METVLIRVEPDLLDKKYEKKGSTLELLRMAAYEIIQTRNGDEWWFRNADGSFELLQTKVLDPVHGVPKLKPGNSGNQSVKTLLSSSRDNGILHLSIYYLWFQAEKNAIDLCI